MDYIISETIGNVFQGNTCWVIYKGEGMDSPIRSSTFASINVIYQDGTAESFVAPLIATRDGLMTWANYFPNFVGVIHQDTKPTNEQIESFKKEMSSLEEKIAEMMAGGSENSKDKEPEDIESQGRKTIKFNPKHKKPGNPDDNK